jgi:hypothetical protein
MSKVVEAMADAMREAVTAYMRYDTSIAAAHAALRALASSPEAREVMALGMAAHDPVVFRMISETEAKEIAAAALAKLAEVE